jgi:hypothetical protein
MSPFLMDVQTDMTDFPVFIIYRQIGPGSSGFHVDEFPLSGGIGKPFHGEIGPGQLIHPFPVGDHIPLPVGVDLLQGNINVVIFRFVIGPLGVLLGDYGQNAAKNRHEDK